MPTRFVTIQNKVYQFDYDYKNTDFRREALNRMTKETWGFSFERWYQNGFWPDSCVPYSLFDLQKMVSHVTATTFTFALEGKTLKALQLGTVMTDPDYRGRGLSRWLIDRVLEDFEQQVDFVFLYANDSVLDFYPKFGFKCAPEFFAVAEQTGKDRIAANKADVRKLDVTQQQDQQILMRIASQTTAQYRMTPLQNQSMLFLYSGFSELSFLENSLYYFPEMDAVAIASVKEDTLAMMFCPRKRFHWTTSFLPCLIPRPSGRSFIFFRKNCPVFPFSLLSKKTPPYLFGEPICSLQNSSVFLSPAIPDFLFVCPSPSWWRAFLFLTLDG